MKVRLANQHDCESLSDLILASAPQSLTAIFDINSQFHCKGFLLSALANENGQFGYANHWVIEQQGAVIGSVSAWYSELDKTFHQATLHSLMQYYGAEHVLEVLSRSQLVQEFIPKPKAQQWCIGHLAVAESFQRQGAATVLLNVMSQAAKQHNKIELSLDVPIDNHSAITFYQHHGFKIQQQSILSQAMLDAGFSSHLHMGKSLV
tara:strand:+ start:1636 stop:2253 length:618 start_codon:yes stop_codon:yes gene_type:complete